MNFKKIHLISAVWLGVSFSAHAQFINPYSGRPYNLGGTTVADTIIRGDMNRAMKEALSKKKGNATNATGTASPTSQTVAHLPASATDFTPGKGRPAVEQFLNDSGLKGEDRKNIRFVIDTTFTEVEKQFRKNNVATGMALAIGTATEITTGNEISDDQGKKLMTDINDILGAAPSFIRKSAAEKQNMYDTLVVVSGVMLALKTAGDSDPAARKTSKEFAASVLNQLTGTAN